LEGAFAVASFLSGHVSGQAILVERGMVRPL
jgi:hypothetical protein